MNLVAFFSFVVITAGTPGPNNILSMEAGKVVGLRRALMVTLGITAGFVVVGALCYLLSEGIQRLLPNFMYYLMLVGTLYILWLAWKISFSKGTPEQKGGIFTGATAFFMGLLLQFVNVKLYFYFIAAINGFIKPNSTGLPYDLFFLAIMCLIGFISTTLWAGFGSLFQRFFQAYEKWVNAVLSLLLVYCAISIWR